jgi:membrane-bound lytic murein transglycosylase A
VAAGALALVAHLCLEGCLPSTPPPSPQVLQPVTGRAVPSLTDDRDRASLVAALDHSLTYYRALDDATPLAFGDGTVPAGRLRATLEAFRDLVVQPLSVVQFNQELRERFDLYRSAGSDGRGRVVYTGYFEPELDASLTPTDDYRHPLYGLPEDLVTVDLGQFRDDYRGRTLAGRLAGRRLVPYADRGAIVAGALAGRGLEIAWVRDPVEAFFLQIEGSGRLRLPDGSTRHVNYAGANGHPYRSIGKILIENGEVDPDEMSMQEVKAWLHDHPERAHELLAANRSYVFFELADAGPYGNIGVPLTPERSIATDPAIFPKGALTYITTQEPVVAPDGHTVIGWRPLARFALNQDTGGAIRGPARVDLFWGTGDGAAVRAGHLRHEGSLYWLLLKES